MKYSVLIVEDELHQQERLSSLLKDSFPEFHVVGIASTIQEGKILLEKHSPDLAFMDVMLPPHTSFDLLSSLSSIPFEIIFTTSFEEYAVRAFRLSAIDYLLKPVAEEELAAALEKFKQKKSTQDSSTQIKNLLANLHTPQANQSKVALPTLTGFIFVTIKDIVRCESDNTYTTFFTSDGRKIIASKTLKECEQMLTDHHFFRVHNSHFINMEYIVEYTKGEGGMVRMADGANIDVSRRRKDEFLRNLKRI
jgi:two-component system, LytTR family, response regulator